MTNVYEWPCVGVLGREWTVEDTVNVSRSLFTGAESITRSQRRRRLAELRVSSLSAGQQGAGYMEIMKRLLRGGEHAVRLYSYPVNHRDVVGPINPIAESLTWTMPPEVLTWSSGGFDLVWFTGAFYSATPMPITLLEPFHGIGRASVTGLTAGQFVARVGSFVTVFSADGTSFETRMLLREVRGSPSGSAIIWTDEPFSYAGSAQFNSRDTGVFKPLSMPRALKPRSGDWEYSWSFREIFEDEVEGGFTEVPWVSSV